MSMIYIGIDPGLKGGIAVFDTTEGFLRVDRTPLIRKKDAKDQFDIPGMVALLDYPSDRVKVTIEQVGARPGQGVTSMFRFGFGLGIWHGIIVTRGFELLTVTPQKWKGHYQLDAEKESARAKANEMFPRCQGRWKLKKHDGLFEAALIGHYGLSLDHHNMLDPDPA